MLVLMVALAGTLVYVICDKDPEGKEFTEIRPTERETR